ncbi:hypothetical protein [Rhodococcus sp. NCIMB 12038]|uniref:hypothetical protein n=1 Tax=Rhodococcus sp. NCIMB 12038 TaxID=933800 RepID=UPI000B3CCEFD|nr:hypothetical protein [Rhodococcus sp. NCIMB 12038]OUS96582.1 hypothetical protein CA951_07620 [Rhodococcus sp. NCIMB 12038]
MRLPRPGGTAVPAVLTAVVLIAVTVVLGALNPVRRAPVSTDTLGPDNGEVVADYLARADRSLDEADGRQERWALVSFTRPVTTETVRDAASGTRVSQVLFRVPLDRVQTPLVPVSVAAGDAALARASDLAAGRAQAMTGETARQAQIAAVSSAELARNCACVIGVVVRGDHDALAALRSEPDVRAVEALGADAVAGRFAVRPLLPEQVETVAPGPDDGVVPGSGS